MESMTRGFYKMYAVMLFAAMIMYCIGGIGKVELLLSSIFLQLCIIFLVLCRIKSIIEKLIKK